MKKLITVIACLGMFYPFEVMAIKRALLIGNANYQEYRNKEQRLENPCRDVKLVSSALKNNLNFDVITPYCDLDLNQIQQAVADFQRSILIGDVVLFYYSGHGVQVDGRNYMVPLRHEIDYKEDLPEKAYPFQSLVSSLEYSGASLRLIMLDACRNSALESKAKTKNGDAGLSQMEGTSGTIIQFATKANRTASDGAGRSSPYALAINAASKDAAENQMGIQDFFNSVATYTENFTAKKQSPMTYQSALYSLVKYNLALTSPANDALVDTAKTCLSMGKGIGVIKIGPVVCAPSPSPSPIPSPPPKPEPATALEIESILQKLNLAGSDTFHILHSRGYLLLAGNTKEISARQVNELTQNLERIKGVNRICNLLNDEQEIGLLQLIKDKLSLYLLERKIAETQQTISDSIDLLVIDGIAYIVGELDLHESSTVAELATSTSGIRHVVQCI